MMRDSVDLRVKRTQMVLREALIDLIEEKGFDAVTVRDIAERAMVNRTTFYRHYPDKYALVTGIFEEAVNQLFNEIGSPEQAAELLSMWDALGAKAAQPINLDPLLTAWSGFLDHIIRHARLYRIMLGRRGSAWFTAQVRDSFAQAIRQRAEAIAAQKGEITDDPNAAPLEFVIVSLANWFVGTLVWWIENGTVYSSQQMTIWSARFAMRGYPSALGLHLPTQSAQ